MEKGVLMQERLCGYRNGRDPQLLDLIEIEFLAPQQHPFQPENHVINPRSRWQHRGTGSCKDVLPAVENVKGPLWANVGSSKHGQNDEIPQEVAPGLKNSLKLVQTDELVVRVKMEGRQIQRLGGASSVASSYWRAIGPLCRLPDCGIENDLKTCAVGTD